MADLSTYQDVIDMVREITQDGDSGYRLISEEHMDIWANECMFEMAEHAEYRDEQVESTLTPGSASISIGGDAIGIWRVEIDDESIYPTTTRDLYQLSRTWQAQTGYPRWYYMDSLRQVGSDNLFLELWPIPSAADDLRVSYTLPGDVLDSGSATEFVMLPLWCVHNLAWGILSKFYAAETRMQNRKAAEFYGIMYEEAKTRLRARSYSKLDLSAQWGAGRKGVPQTDLRQLMPSDGFPV